MNMPSVTDAHRKLERLAGNWIGEEKVHPSPFDPKGGPATGRVSNRRALDGFAVVQDYEQERGGKTNFRGHGVFRFDAMQNAYFMHWFDSMGFPPGEYRGQFEGDVLTLTCENPQHKSRAIFNLQQSDKYTFKMEVSPDGTAWYPFMEGTYTKKG